MESTENTVSANWEHGPGAEYYYTIITTNEEVYAVSNIIDRYQASSSSIAGRGRTIFSDLTSDTLYTVTIQSFTLISNGLPNVGGEVSATIRTKSAGTNSDIPVGDYVSEPVITYIDHTTNGFTAIWGAVSNIGSGSEGEMSSFGYLLELFDERMVTRGRIIRRDYLATEETFTNLMPGTAYRVMVLVTNEASFIKSIGEGKDTYTLRHPGSVDTSTISYSEHTTNGFKVSWGGVTDAGYGPEGELTTVGYVLEWSSDQGRTWESVVRSNYLATTETFSDLAPGTGYRVRITTTNGYIDAASSEGGATWTLALHGQVEDLVVSVPRYNITANKGGFKVSWAAPKDTGITSNGQATTVTGYEVAYAKVGEVIGEYVLVADEVVTTEYIFTELDAGAEYDIRVRAKTDNGSGEGSHVSGWVPSLPEVVDPGSISFSNRTSSNMGITWAAPEPGRDGGSSASNTRTSYRVEVYPTGGGGYTMVWDHYFDTTLTIPHLNRLSSYRAHVIAKNKWGEAEPSVSISTGVPPSAVGGLKVDSVSDSQVMLSWNAPPDPGILPTDPGAVERTNVATITGYVVKYKGSGDDDFIEIDERSEGVRLAEALTGTTATVNGLSGNTGYTFMVVAVSSANYVGWDRDAPRIEQTTAPASPRNLREAQCTRTTTVDLVWDASMGATSYKLYRNGTEISDVTGTSYTDTGLTSGESYTYKVQSCKGGTCLSYSEDLQVKTITATDKNFKYIIDCGRIPEDLTDYDDRSQEIFSRYVTNTPIVARYLNPGGTGDGSFPTNKAGNLKTVLERIPDASADKVYVVLLTGGNYQAGSQMAMKNHVAIIGGLDEDLGFSATVTELDGNNSYRVFFNDNNGLNNTALLYGVTVTSGKTTSYGGGMYNQKSSPSLVEVTFSNNTADRGGGMWNNTKSSPSLREVIFSGNTAGDRGGGMVNWDSSSPSLSNVTFSENKANTEDGGGMYNWNSSSPSLEGVIFSENTARNGGGMYNWNSSPILSDVTFSGNEAVNNGGGMDNDFSSPSLVGVTFSSNTAANKHGGGMANYNNSRPILSDVTFSGNTAKYFGGGMYNNSSSPTLEGVTFSGNTADRYGGGMYNVSSSPSLVGVTFSGNTATYYGGGMYNDNDGKDGALIINGIFWGNTADNGPEFYFLNDNTGQENLRIYNSIVKGGTGTLVSGTTYTSVNQRGFVSDGGSASIAISFANIITNDPGLGALANNGGSVLTHAIPSNSPAVDQGLYVKKSGDTLYYSDDNTDWYTDPMLTTAVTLPAGAEDLTATDATGHTRTDRPDLGAYEYR